MQDPLPSHGTCPNQVPPSLCEHPPACLPHRPRSPLELCLHHPPPLMFPAHVFLHKARGGTGAGTSYIPALLPVRRLLLLVLRLLLPTAGLRTEQGDVSNEA